MKTEYDKKGNMIINTGYKLFDNQTNLITTGNVISNTQYSSYIRPYKEVINGGHIGKCGDFMKYDMQYFKQIPNAIKKYLLNEEREDSCILYEIFVNKQDDRGNYYRDIIGYILTDKNHKYIMSDVLLYPYCRIEKRYNVIDECKKYICA